MLAHDHRARDAIAEMIRGAADDVVTKQIRRKTQEPAITSRIAESLEASLKGAHVFGYQVSAVAIEMPDRGPGSMEKVTGVDLFVAIRVRSTDNKHSVSKGLLIQSKLAATSGKPSERKRLKTQCEEMANRSPKGAYVWIYGPLGIRSVPASEVLHYPSADISALDSRNIAEHFRDVLDCIAGDEALASDGIFENDQSLRIWMEDFAARRGIAIDVVGPPVESGGRTSSRK